MGRKGKATGP